MILAGEFAIGDKLPSQRDLAALFGVSRTALREGLSLLEASGILRTEAGRGTFVTGKSGSSEETQPNPRRSTAYSGLDVCRFRHLIDGYSARLAAMQITDEQLSELESNLALFKEQTRAMDFAASARTDLQFHSRIVEIAGNQLLADIHREYHELLLRTLTMPRGRYSRGWEPVVEHERILEAMKRRDPDEARYYMQSHIVRSADRLGILMADEIL